MKAAFYRARTILSMRDEEAYPYSEYPAITAPEWSAVAEYLVDRWKALTLPQMKEYYEMLLEIARRSPPKSLTDIDKELRAEVDDPNNLTGNPYGDRRLNPYGDRCVHRARSEADPNNLTGIWYRGLAADLAFHGGEDQGPAADSIDGSASRAVHNDEDDDRTPELARGPGSPRPFDDDEQLHPNSDSSSDEGSSGSYEVATCTCGEELIQTDNQCPFALREPAAEKKDARHPMSGMRTWRGIVADLLDV